MIDTHRKVSISDMHKYKVVRMRKKINKKRLNEQYDSIV